MKLDYRYYRHNFIKLTILGVAILAMFWGWVHGSVKAEPGVMPLLAILFIVGGGALFLAMSHAKRREEDAKFAAQISVPRSPECVSNGNPGVKLARERKRTFMAVWSIGGGILICAFARNYLIDGMPAPWIGYLFIGVGVLAILRVNVFIGGPLDRRLDRQDDSKKNISLSKNQ